MNRLTVLLTPEDLESILRCLTDSILRTPLGDRNLIPLCDIARDIQRQIRRQERQMTIPKPAVP